MCIDRQQRIQVYRTVIIFIIFWCTENDLKVYRKRTCGVPKLHSKICGVPNWTSGVPNWTCRPTVVVYPHPVYRKGHVPNWTYPFLDTSDPLHLQLQLNFHQSRHSSCVIESGKEAITYACFLSTSTYYGAPIRTLGVRITPGLLFTPSLATRRPCGQFIT